MMDHVQRAVFRTLLCLAAVATLGRVAAAHDPTTTCAPLELRIHLQVDRSINRLDLADLKDETASLWMPYGVRLEWVDVPADETATRSLSLEAILERRIGERNEPTWTPVLGKAFVNLEAPTSRPILVSFEGTQKLLALRATSRASMAGLVTDRELARALGRVLAHEIGHVLLGARNHDDTGLMRVSFRPDELAAPDRAPFRLTCIDIGRLRSRMCTLTGIEQEPADRETCSSGRVVP